MVATDTDDPLAERVMSSGVTMLGAPVNLYQLVGPER